ncbi:hypothetical protein ACFFQW_45185 [Umezawaea endophytica]|uniref:DUF3168 domain-containing protein n=1 Tax=Umezawaea endophytica TaxID=1654476 RepID=A0A9X2VXS7_9PSEU|nr:hypothetical protein [Umezawaea endophytica]MCS7484654.1 hypothetical protein [Umezawaea endophytica]
MTLPVPVDVAELVVRMLRPLLAARPELEVAGAKVSTETGHGPQGGPPSLPWLLVAEDGHTWTWPAVERAVIRLTCWHRSEHTAKAVAGLALALLCDHHDAGVLITAEPVAGPVAGLDPHTDQPLATAAVAVYARTPTRR